MTSALAEDDAQSVTRACARFRLQRELPRAALGRGDVIGAGVGSSVEFQDFRAYVPGDDPRHIDWAAYGRTQQLFVRLYRPEVNPSLDLVVDGSRSMALDDGHKAALVRRLVGFLLRSARLQNTPARLWEVGDQTLTHREVGQLRLEGQATALFGPRRSAVTLRRGSQRIVVSDFMVHHPLRPRLRQLAANAAQLVVVRVLGPWEAKPTAGAAVTLTDVETGQERVVRLSDAMRRDYGARLTAIGAELRDGCRELGVPFVDVRANSASVDDVLDEALETAFLPLGVVVPARC